jgi:hypothetical protein
MPYFTKVSKESRVKKNNKIFKSQVQRSVHERKTFVETEKKCVQG